MKCPKCGHEQSSQVSCESCGVIFAKLARHAVRMRELELVEAEAREARNRRRGYMALAIVVLVAAGSFWWWSKPGQEAPRPHADQQQPVAGSPQGPGYWMRKPQGLEWQPVPQEQAFQQATQAVVTFASGNATGIAFFVTRHCQAVTANVLIEEKPRSSAGGYMMDSLLEVKRHREQELEQKRKEFSANCQRCDEQELKRYVGQTERHLREAIQNIAEQQQREDQHAEQQSDAITVRLDSQSLKARVVRRSHRLDLALLQIEVPGCEVIDTLNLDELHEGELLSGFALHKSAIRSGNFLGMQRSNEGERYLQHELSGVSNGSPLLTKQGQVVAIHVASLGKGMAVPIDVALKELGLGY